MKLISKEEFAQIITACEVDPTQARIAKEKLFEEQHYKRIFIDSEPYFYLSRYWLMKLIDNSSKKSQERRESRFHVMNFMWSQIAPMIRAKSKCREMIEQCERKNSDFTNHLNSAIDFTFQSMKEFFIAHRGAGNDKVDVATFFKSKRANIKTYIDFWNKSSKFKDRTLVSLEKF